MGCGSSKIKEEVPEPGLEHEELPGDHIALGILDTKCSSEAAVGYLLVEKLKESRMLGLFKEDKGDFSISFTIVHGMQGPVFPVAYLTFAIQGKTLGLEKLSADELKAKIVASCEGENKNKKVVLALSGIPDLQLCMTLREITTNTYAKRMVFSDGWTVMVAKLGVDCIGTTKQGLGQKIKAGIKQSMKKSKKDLDADHRSSEDQSDQEGKHSTTNEEGNESGEESKENDEDGGDKGRGVGGDFSPTFGWLLTAKHPNQTSASLFVKSDEAEELLMTTGQVIVDRVVSNASKVFKIASHFRPALKTLELLAKAAKKAKGAVCKAGDIYDKTRDEATKLKHFMETSFDLFDEVTFTHTKTLKSKKETDGSADCMHMVLSVGKSKLTKSSVKVDVPQQELMFNFASEQLVPCIQSADAGGEVCLDSLKDGVKRPRMKWHTGKVNITMQLQDTPSSQDGVATNTAKKIDITFESKISGVVPKSCLMSVDPLVLSQTYGTGVQHNLIALCERLYVVDDDLYDLEFTPELGLARQPAKYAGVLIPLCGKKEKPKEEEFEDSENDDDSDTD